MFGKSLNICVLILTVLLSQSLLVRPVLAQHIPANLLGLRGWMSGNWYNPGQSGHGVQIELLDNGRAVVAWYTYDADGNPLWLFGTGKINLDTIEAGLSVFEDGRPPPNWDAAEPAVEPWGTVAITFDGCDTGVLAWDSTDPAFGAGELPIERLTKIGGMRCGAEELFSQQFIWSFDRRMQNFEAVFADLPEDYHEPTFQLDYRREQLPPPLHGYSGLRLTSHNSSDDLAKLVKTPIRGLMPDAYYRVELDVEIATSVPTGCVGIGGSPGESVYVKLGASGAEPVAVVDPVDGWLRLNIDYGQQSQEGANARVAGNLSNSQDCADGPDGDWELKSLTTQGQTMIVPTDPEGTLWVFAGTDSAFEGLTQYYITTLRARLEPYEAETP